MIHEIAQRADQAPPDRLSALVYGVLLLVLAAVAWPVTTRFFDTANLPPSALALLRGAASPVPVEPSRSRQPLAILLIDGLRADEVPRMGALARMRERAAWTLVDLPLPTLSRPFYHTFLTGVPQSGTGVRTNRYDGRARLDTLADRVRAAGGRFSVVASGLDWIGRMHGRPGDALHAQAASFERTAHRALGRLRPGKPDLLIVHSIAVDKAGHRHGVRSPMRARALGQADALVAGLDRRARRRGISLAVGSDHGHIVPGGHGGDEPAVARVPWMLRDARLEAGGRRGLPASALAPILAARMGVAPPRSAVAAVPAGWGPAPEDAVRAASARARILEQATRLELRRLRHRRWWMVPLALLLWVAALGATKRAFRGLALGTLVAPVLWLALVLASHRYLLGRPFTLSAIDDVTRHGTRLVLLGATCAVVAVTAGAFLPWLGRRRRGPVESPLVPLRRAAAATGWLAFGAMLASFAWLGGAAGPWPLGAHAYYVPVLAPAAGGGACIAAGLTLVLSAPMRAFTGPT